MTTPRTFGWAKDSRDHRDYESRAKVCLYPDQMDLSGLLADVRDQGSVGSCVGQSAALNADGMAIRLGAGRGPYSATWAYNGARESEGTLSEDAGCFPRSAFEFLTKRGCLLQKYWPYDPHKLDTSAPPRDLYDEAGQWPLVAYYRVVDGVDGLLSALADGHLVSIGNPWFAAWMNPPATGRLAEDYSMTVGGHETLLYGYDLVSKVFYGQNSWGEGWGKNGRYEMPFSAIAAFKARGGYDAHYIAAAGWTVDPGPAPAPKKRLTWLYIAAGVIALAITLALIL